MLICGLGIGLIIAGIVALVTGRIKFSRTRAVQGVAARLLGVALLFPLPAGFLAGTIYTVTHVNPNQPDEVQAWARQHDAQINGIVAGTMIGLAVLIIIVAAILAKPIQPEGRRRGEDDYDDYERGDRARRPAAAGDEPDDRPRRRRPADDEDDRGRPRRGDDLDDRAR